MSSENRHNTQLLSLIDRYEASLPNGHIPFFDRIDFFTLIEHYESNNNYKQALDIADAAVTQHGYSVDVYRKKAQLLVDSNQLPEAIVILNKAIILDPSDLESYFLKAEAINLLGNYDASIQVLEDLKKGKSLQSLSEIYFNMAYLHEYHEDYDNMFACLCDAIHSDIENSSALDRMWLCVELSEKYKESVAFHKSIIDLHPYSHLAWYNLGHAYSCLEELEQAIEAYEYAFIINENFEFAYRDYAENCISLAKYEKALKALAHVMHQFKVDCDLYYKSGYCYEMMEQFDKAKAFYRRAIAENPNFAPAHYRIGLCYFKEDKLTEAMNCYRKALTLDPKKEEFVAGLAEVYVALEQYDDAKQMFAKAVELAPDQSKYWLQYAGLMQELGEYKDALHILDEASYHAPANEVIYFKISCLFQSGRRKEALSMLNLALSNNFSLHDALFAINPDLVRDSDVIETIDAYKFN